jgi:hypothetical protein
MITPFQLQQALRAMGVAEVFVGDPTIAGGMVSLGATEGEIGFEATEASNNLTAPESTGGIPHQATVTLESAVITIPLIMGDPALWAKVSATGSAGGGFSTPQRVQETSVLLIPRSELGGGLAYTLAGGWTRTAGNGVAGAAGAEAAPQNAIWLWRAYLTRGRVPFRYAEGGKVISEIRATGMMDVSKPEGQMVYTIGAPEAEGVLGIVL